MVVPTLVATTTEPAGNTAVAPTVVAAMGVPTDVGVNPPAENDPDIGNGFEALIGPRQDPVEEQPTRGATPCTTVPTESL